MQYYIKDFDSFINEGFLSNNLLFKNKKDPKTEALLNYKKNTELVKDYKGELVPWELHFPKSKKYFKDYVKIYKKYWEQIYNKDGSMKVDNKEYIKLQKEFIKEKNKLQSIVLAVSGKLYAKNEADEESEKLNIYVANDILLNPKI
jgi:hypothetical protein